MQSKRHDTIRPIRWTGEAIELLDQRHLPERMGIFVARDVSDTCRAISEMVVRGAPAIGITAAYGVALAARDRYRASAATWVSDIETDLRALEASRPTAVNLAWAVARMRARFDAVDGDPFPPLAAAAAAIHEEDIAANQTMGEIGAACIEAGAGVLTHCNAGALATGGYGTALGVIRSAFARGALGKVYADETRPWLQGARLTAWELVQESIPVSLIADSAAAYAMSQGRIQWVIVGADRVAANGDVANKIGTYALALSARHHGVKFMVAAPTSTIDLGIPDGSRIPIEIRAKEELLGLGPVRLAADGADAWNPVFDVTPARLVDVLVTERGALWLPDAPSIARLMAE